MTSENNLENYIESNRQHAFNALRLKSKPKEILVYVEDTHDIAFWHGILNPYEQKVAIKFKVSAYSDNTATTGKGKLQKKISKTGLNLIICLDSDYDYLLPESDRAKEIKQNPYIFQTYTYGMENLKCYAESLNNLCIRATHNSMDDIINFSDFLKDYSQVIYPLFMWNLYYYQIKKPNHFSISNFNKLVTIGNINFDNYQTLLKQLQESISDKLQEFNSDVDMSQFYQQFSELNKTNAYLFINGHALYSTILNLIKAVCKKLENNHRKKIERLAKTQQERVEKIQHYRNSTHSVKTLLANNNHFTDCFLFKKITTDIEIYLALFKQQIQELNYV